MSKSLLLLLLSDKRESLSKSDMRDLLVFLERITLSLLKNEPFAQQFSLFSPCFWQFFTAFPIFMPKRELLPLLFAPITFFKRATAVIRCCALSLTKKSDSHKSPKSKFPTLILAQISAQFFFLSSFPNVYCEFCGNVSLTEIKFIVIKVIVTTTTNTTNISLIIFLFWKEILSSLFSKDFHTCI